MRIQAKPGLLTGIIFITCFLSCHTPPQSSFEYLLTFPSKHLENYDFKPELPVSERVGPVPGFVLQDLQQMDQADNYMSYTPTGAELQQIETCLGKLPPLYQQVLQEYLAGIYFVENLTGSGLADLVLDDAKNVYAIMILNPEVLKHSLSEWMTRRESSCFRPDDPAWHIELDCGSGYTGLMYILLHETGHVADLIHHFTPFIWEQLDRYRGEPALTETPFTAGVWQAYATPAAAYDYPFRRDITFYGFTGPVIPVSTAVDIYQKLAETPFASLYGSMSWAEDFAEIVTWYHFTEQLHQPYRINVYKSGQLRESFSPADFPLCRERFNLIKALVYH